MNEQEKEDSAPRGFAEAGMRQKPPQPTLLEAINERIEHHNLEITRLMRLRVEAPPVLLHIPLRYLQSVAYLDQNPF